MLEYLFHIILILLITSGLARHVLLIVIVELQQGKRKYVRSPKTQAHFHLILLAKASHMDKPKVKGAGKPLSLFCERLQSHVVKDMNTERSEEFGSIMQSSTSCIGLRSTF